MRPSPPGCTGAFPAECDVGIELAVNRRYTLGGGTPRHKLRAYIIEGLRRSIAYTAA